MDEYNNFVFYGSWRTAIEGYREDFGDEYAKELLYNIMLYGTTGEIETEKKSIRNCVLGMAAPNIDAAQKRYEAAVNGGKKGGRKKKLNDEDDMNIAQLRSEGYTAAQLAEMFNVSEATIKRSEGWKNPQSYIADQNSYQNSQQNISSNISSVQKEDIDNDIDIDKEKEIDEETGLLFSTLKGIAEKYNQSIEWVKIGIGMKKPEEWQTHGYGLFAKKDFQDEVSIKFKEYLVRQQEIKKNQEIIRQQRENKIVVKVPSFHQESKKKKKEIDFNTLI